MKFITALRKYFALNTAQRQFVKQSKRKFNMTQAAMVEFLTPLAVFDLECDLAINQLFKFNLFSFFAIIIGLVITSAIPYAFILSVLAFVTLILGLISRIILGGINIHNSLREFVLPLINTLGEDTAPGKNMLLALDLSGKLLKTKLVSSTKDDPGWFSYPKVTTSIYNDYWLDLQTEFADGSKVHIAIQDRITSRAKKYKGQSGKIKYKTKNKLKQFIKGTVSLRNKAYTLDNPDKLKNSCDRFKTKEGANRSSVTLTRIITHHEADFYPQPAVCIELIGKIFMNAMPGQAKGNQ